MMTPIKKLLQEGALPIGKLEDGGLFSLSSAERQGIMQIFGRSGSGKSVAVENIVLSEIYTGRGGMCIDPYGDIIADIQERIPSDKEKKVATFAATEKTLQANIEKFEHEIHLAEMQNDDQKFLLCNVNYRIIGQDVARQFGLYLIKQFLYVVGVENRSIVLDEAYNFVDDEILEHLVNSKKGNSLFVLADQTVMQYRSDIVQSLLQKVDHIICYNVDAATASLINTFHPELNAAELTAIEKYHFYAKYNAQSESPRTMTAETIFPIPYQK